MPTYNDIMMRDALDDTGQQPYTGSYVWMSPDIIPQQSPCPPAQVQTLFGQPTWTQNPGQGIENGQINYIYLRGQNLGTATTTATITLYKEQATTMLSPSIWSSPANTIGSTTLTLTAGQIAAAPQPILWTVPPGTSGYCLIARVVTPNNPNPIPGAFANPTAFYNWVRANPNVANRNLLFVDVLPNTSLQRTLQVRNAYTVPTPVLFTIECDNFATGSTLSVYCPDPSINSGNWTINSSAFTVTNSGLMPVGFANALVITVTPPTGQTIPANAQLIVSEWDGSSTTLADTHSATPAYRKARDAWLQQEVAIPYKTAEHFFEVGGQRLVKVGGATIITMMSPTGGG